MHTWLSKRGGPGSLVGKRGVGVGTCQHVTDRRPAELPGEHCPSAAYDCQLVYEPC